MDRGRDFDRSNHARGSGPNERLLMTPVILALAGGLTASGVLIFLAALVGALWMAEPSVPGPQDEQLRLDAAAGAAATTQTASTNSAALDMGAGFAPGGLGQPVAGVIDFTAADRADSNETYTFKLQDSPDNSSFTDITPAVAIAVSGTTAPLTTIVLKGFQSQRYVRLVSTIGGTTPSVTFKAWLRPLKPAA